MKIKLFVLLFAVSASGFYQCTPKPAGKGAVKIKTEQIAALDSVNEEFIKLSAVVDSISCNLSGIEKERAAFFLVSAYSLVIQSYVERGNPGAPGFTDWMVPPRKFGGDNPYTIYSQAPVSPEFSYKLSGRLGSCIYFGIQLYGMAGGFNLPTANLGKNDIVFNKDGSFDIYISAKRPDGVKNWLPLQNGDHAFIVRQYFDKREGNIPAQIKIERTDHNPSTGTTYLQRLENARKMITEYIMGSVDVSELLRENAFNKYPSKDAEIRSPKYGGALFPTKDNRYEGCWISLKEGEAMCVHGYLPQNTLYASYVFYDRWYNTPSYPEVNCFRTMNEIVLNPDRSFDLYVSPETIDHPNWINTGGLYEGSYSSRYMQSTDTVFPSLEVVKIKDIPPFWK